MQQACEAEFKRMEEEFVHEDTKMVTKRNKRRKNYRKKGRKHCKCPSADEWTSKMW